MTKQEATEQIALLIQTAETVIHQAAELAREHKLEFTIDIGPGEVSYDARDSYGCWSPSALSC
jgi:hypothetical protein